MKNKIDLKNLALIGGAAVGAVAVASLLLTGLGVLNSLYNPEIFMKESIVRVFVSPMSRFLLGAAPMVAIGLMTSKEKE